MIIPYYCPHCGKEMQGELSAANTDAACSHCLERSKIPPTGPAPGVVLGGGFRIDRKIRSGSIGDVYLGFQSSMDRQVMIKILPREDMNDPETVGRFQREVKLTAGLQHPNLLSAIDAGEDCGFLYMVTPWRDGVTLEKYLEENKKLDAREAIRLLLPIARAMKFAWDEKQIIHRNIKPAAIIVPKDGETILTDLGIARSTVDQEKTLTGAGFVVGTPTYMSPEQCRGVFKLDFKTDIYAFGCLFYECLAGRPPFDDANPMTVMQHQLRTPAPDVSEVESDVPRELSRLILAMMAKEREDRPESWSAVVEGLEDAARAARKAAAHAAPPSPPKRKLSGPAGPAASRPPVPVVAPAGGSAAKMLVYVVLLVAVIAVLAAAGLRYMAQQDADLPARPADPASPFSALPAEPSSATDSDSVRRPSAALSAEFDTASTWLYNHPGDYQPAIDRLAAVRTKAEKAGATTLRNLADEEITRLVDERKTGIARVITTLRGQAGDLLRQGREGEARELLLTYSGEFASETERPRQVFASNLEELRNAPSAGNVAPLPAKDPDDGTAEETATTPKGGEVATNENDARLNALRQRVIILILGGDARTAAELLKPAIDSPDYKAWQPDLQELADIADEVAQRDTLIYNTFKEDVGKEVTVKLKTKSANLRIKELKDGEVLAQQPVEQGDLKGWIGMRFKVADLHAEEREKRLRRIDLPYRQYILIVEARGRGDIDAARHIVELLGTPLATAFGAAL